MADNGNQGGKLMWPSFATASWLYDWANVFLIGALVVGAVSTVLIVWMGNVKEEYLRRDLASTGLNAAHAVLQTSILSGEVAAATERAAVAEQRAAEANLELARMKTSRALTPEQQEALATRIRSFAGTTFDVGVIQGNAEAQELMIMLESVLKIAGWKQVDWDGGDIVLTRPNRPTAGLVTAVNIVVAIHSDKAATTLGSAAAALGEALNVVGIATKAGTTAAGFIAKNNDAVHILIGHKT